MCIGTLIRPKMALCMSVRKVFDKMVCLVAKFEENIFTSGQDFAVILSSALTLSPKFPSRVFLIVCYRSIYVSGDMDRLLGAYVREVRFSNI